MKALTIATSNRNRLDLDSDSTKLFIKSLENQINKDFEVVIADGGSNNVEELDVFFKLRDKEPQIRIVKFPIGETFERARLNNVGVRNANTSYVMTTDVDMFFAKDFIEELLQTVSEKYFVESRTLYWKGPIANKIYQGIIDPFADLDKCKIGRIKKSTTAGGCQCAHMDLWNKVRGFDENFVGWGSEDYDLLTRMGRVAEKVIWLGQSIETIKVFHQPHPKPNIQYDLECQEKNKKLLNMSQKIRKHISVNSKGWGGILEADNV